MTDLQLLKPCLEHLPAYVAALQRGWSPDNVRGRTAAEEHLIQIAEDATAFVVSQDDPEGRGAPIQLPDGSMAKRLPGYLRWIWDGQFVGTVGFRWQPGTPDLPADVLGHIGYAVVPWKQGRGYATRALALMLSDARARGMPHVELTTTPDNVPSQKVITANGGLLVGEFEKSPHYGGGPALRYRITV